MLKKTLTYTDFNDKQVTETLYFNLSASELIEMEVDKEEGFGEFLKRIVAEGDNKIIFAEFKKFILAAYGERSADGKRFEKSEEISHAFSQTAAYAALFLEIATDGNKMADFINGLMPQEFAAQFGNPLTTPMPTDPRDPAFAAMQAAAQRTNVIDVPLPPPTT